MNNRPSQPLNRRRFIRHSAGAILATSAAAGLAPGVMRPEADIPAKSLILIWLGGGLPQFDTFDPKAHTPFQPGMKGSELLSTCSSIPTAAPGVRFGRGLENLAGVMNHGLVIRSLTRQTALPGHEAAESQFLNPIFLALTGSEPSGPTQLSAPADQPPQIEFHQRLLAAARLAQQGERFQFIPFRTAAFNGFDAHAHGATRIAGLKRMIDRPIASLIEALENRKLLNSTIVCIASEFGRTIPSPVADGRDAAALDETHTGEHLTLRSLADYGHHGHFSRCSSLLLFGGPFRRGAAYGRTADQHPLLPVENPISLPEFQATLLRALQTPMAAMPQELRALRPVSALLRTGVAFA